MNKYLLHCRTFFYQELRQRFSDNLLGISWVFIFPIAQIILFYYVFLHILKANVDGLQGKEYLTFLVLGIWPWISFSEGISKASNSFISSQSIANKVAISRTAPLIASVTSVFSINIAGYIIILIILSVFGINFKIEAIALAAISWGLLYILTIGVGTIFAIINVFLRDLSQIMHFIITLWFYLTPILYSVSSLPEKIQKLFSYNPITEIINSQRAMVYFIKQTDINILKSAVICGLFLFIGVIFYKRMRFLIEEYL